MRVAVVDVPGAGRGVVAATNLQPGEIVASCMPYAVAMEPAAAPHICLGCGRFAKRALPISCKVRRNTFFTCASTHALAAVQRRLLLLTRLRHCWPSSPRTSLRP